MNQSSPKGNYRNYFRLTAVALLLPIFIYAATAIHIRYMADDYCMITHAQQLGVLGNINRVYQSWAGGYSTVAIMSITGLIGPIAEPIELVFALSLWWLILFNLFRLAAQLRKASHATLFGATGASLLCLTTLTEAPNIIQSVYWTNGRVAYFLPIVLMTFIAWLLVQRNIHGWALYFLLGATTFATCGFAITYSLFTVAAIGTARIVFRKHRVAPLLSMTLVAGSIGLLIFVLAPGNAVRQSYFPTPNLFFTFRASLTSPGWPVLIGMYLSPITVLATTVLPFIYARYFDAGLIKHPMQIILGIPIVIYGLVALCFATGYYAVSATLPARVWILPQFIILAGTIPWVYSAGIATRKTGLKPMSVWARRTTLVFLMAATVSSSFKAIETYRDLESYARAWDQRDQKLRSVKDHTATVATKRFGYVFGLEDISTDPTQGWNACIASYYELNSIIGIDE